MLILARLIGFLIIAFGVTLSVFPEFAPKVFGFIKEGKRIYWAGIARGLIGLLLIFLAPRSPLPVAAFSLGTLFILSGILVFTCDLQKLKDVLGHYTGLSEIVIRLLGLMVACFGVLIFTLA